ncbi:hypothetical protein BCR34DRAFT_607546 [Clohesyomyces aquaticus]|uniref:Uncharacterized protein n=1 Tax=Clohesyomyces aquaticus TaxID=1231657 RepID=A0A1Y1YFE5_9PLEO|nr:hypothetical protein BCR34DRAFT_607546 [Clohesyomyces aquaticus]
MRSSDDHSLFAWEFRSHLPKNGLSGLLAPSADHFRNSGTLATIPDTQSTTTYQMTNCGLQIELPLVEGSGRSGITILACAPSRNYNHQIGVHLIRMTEQNGIHYARDGRQNSGQLEIGLELASKAVRKTIFVKQNPDDSPNSIPRGIFVGIDLEAACGYSLEYFHGSRFPLHKGTSESINFFIPASSKRSMIIFSGPDESYLVVLFIADSDTFGRAQILSDFQLTLIKQNVLLSSQ